MSVASNADSILRASSSGDRATRTAEQWAPALPLQRALARRHHPHRPGSSKTAGETRGAGPSSQSSSREDHGMLAPRQMEVIDRARAAGPAAGCARRFGFPRFPERLSLPSASPIPGEAGQFLPIETDRPGGRRPPPLYSWAEMMQRVLKIDVPECPRCQGRRRILAAIHPPEATRKILNWLGLLPVLHC